MREIGKPGDNGRINILRNNAYARSNANWERQKSHDQDYESIPDSPQTLSSIVTEFGLGYSTAHALPNVFKSTSSWGRVIWILIFIGGMIAVFAQMYFLAERYFAFHTAAEVSSGRYFQKFSSA